MDLREISRIPAARYLLDLREDWWRMSNKQLEMASREFALLLIKYFLERTPDVLDEFIHRYFAVEKCALRYPRELSIVTQKMTKRGDSSVARLMDLNEEIRRISKRLNGIKNGLKIEMKEKTA